MNAFLERILVNKRLEVEELKIQRPLDRLIADMPSGPRYSFRGAIDASSGVSIIAELKQRSPSKGSLTTEYDPIDLAAKYKAGGAAALSVLTEKRFFGGHPEHLELAKRTAQLPALCKDFIIDPYQIYHARFINADAILLIVRLLTRRALGDFLRLARELALDALVEVHSHDEAALALEAGADIIGVNNRDLNSFDVDLEIAQRLVSQIPAPVIPVAESGIRGVEDVVRLKQAGYRAFLVGEALVRSMDPIALLQEMARV